jgi:hypothetical protein
MNRIFKDGSDFIICGRYADEPDGGKRYTKKSLMSYIINQAPNIDIDTSALDPADHREIWQAYHKGLRLDVKKRNGIRR